MSSVIDQIRRKFKSDTALSLKNLREYFPARSSRSLTRDLDKIGVITSFSHAGQYRILRTTPRFNSFGLWFFQDIGFSKYGTLKSTIIQLVEASDSGHTHQELNKLLKIKTHNTLKELVDLNLISRRQMPNRLYVYLHPDDKISAKQYNLRESINESSLATKSPPSEWVTIEILVEVVRGYNIGVNANKILQRLSQRGVDIDESTIEHVLTYYEIKKKGI